MEPRFYRRLSTRLDSHSGSRWRCGLLLVRCGDCRGNAILRRLHYQSPPSDDSPLWCLVAPATIRGVTKSLDES